MTTPFGERRIHVTWHDAQGKLRHAWWTPREIGVDARVIERVERLEAGEDVPEPARDDREWKT